MYINNGALFNGDRKYYLNYDYANLSDITWKIITFPDSRNVIVITKDGCGNIEDGDTVYIKHLASFNDTYYYIRQGPDQPFMIDIKDNAIAFTINRKGSGQGAIKVGEDIKLNFNQTSFNEISDTFTNDNYCTTELVTIN